MKIILNIKPCAINETITTETSIITPAIIGLIPTPLTSLKLVLRPIAPSAVASKNFDSFAVIFTTCSDRIPILLIPTNAKKPKINHGNIFEILIFYLVTVSLFFFFLFA